MQTGYLLPRKGRETMAFVELQDVYKRYRTGDIVTAAADGAIAAMQAARYIEEM